MARILAIDYGTKKTGLAVTDPLQIIATGLATIPTAELFEYLKNYFQEEEVVKVVFGESTNEDGSHTDLHAHAVGFSRKLKKHFPALVIDWQDEYGTSKRAKAILLHSGVPQKKRREKERVDKIAAVLILQDYLGHF